MEFIVVTVLVVVAFLYTAFRFAEHKKHARRYIDYNHPEAYNPEYLAAMHQTFAYPPQKKRLPSR